MSIDPLTEDYEDYTPYQFASNQPVHAQEVEGLENSHDLNKRLTESSPIQNDAIAKTKPSVIPLKTNQSNRNSLSGTIRNIDFNNVRTPIGGYVWESLDIAVTEGIQWLGSKLSNSDVSSGTAQNVQLATTLLVVVVSKGKNVNADEELGEQIVKATKGTEKGTLSATKEALSEAKGK